MAAPSGSIEVVDIRNHPHSQNNLIDLRTDIVKGLSRPAGQKTLSTLLLYDERGLQLYDELTTNVPEYYPFLAEEEILKNNAGQIVRAMHGSTDHFNEEVVVELGAGSLRKTSHILKALSHLVPSPTEHPPITYYALDLEKRELDRTLQELIASDVGAEIKGKVEAKGLCATYDDGLAFIQEGGLKRQSLSSNRMTTRYKLENSNRNRSPDSSSSHSHSTETEGTPPSTPGAEHGAQHFLFLGSSLGNFNRGEDAEFLRCLPLQPGSGNTLLLGLDHANEPEKIKLAYNDPKGVTREFVMNGLKNAARTLGDENIYDPSKWEYVNLYNEELHRHEGYYKSKCAQTIVDPASKAEFNFLQDELVRVELSHKFSDEDAYKLFSDSNLRPVHRWTDSASQYSLWLLERPEFLFPVLVAPVVNDGKIVSSPFGLPTTEEWRDMWAAWDFINFKMIPESMLHEKPIDLRHICLFYQGHIPTFLDIHISRLLQQPHTEPDHYKYIFERGIDPIVDNPTQCHPHSEVPQSKEDWPTQGEILGFQARVRERLLNLYNDISTGKITLTRKVARVLFMTLEHEAFHAETLLYMLLQRAGTGTVPPSGFITPNWSALKASWDSAPAPSESSVILGPATITLGHDDVEAEDDSSDVHGHAFGWDNEHPERQVEVDEFRIDWRPISNGQFYDFYKSKGKDMNIPFPASWIEVEGKVQVRTLYGPVPLEIAYHWPIITSFDSLSIYASVKGGRIPTEPELRLFLDKFDCGYEGGGNIGFRNWHPLPATTGVSKNGKGHNGGVWEWTSTVLDTYDGFIPSRLYPGYSTDFFDSHHQVVIGGSYVTIPRLAGRRTVRNYYQHNYPYAWVGARVAYDVKKQ
ncbi:hypothetical protein QCA50_006805 [Cerrena zonata]|uniref:DUF323 domain-containing protein n=1 Tax=Cerrena zonata TaxID=2478898 RepID=A0AAW0G9Y2_9APHY